MTCLIIRQPCSCSMMLSAAHRGRVAAGDSQQRPGVHPGRGQPAVPPAPPLWDSDSPPPRHGPSCHALTGCLPWLLTLVHYVAGHDCQARSILGNACSSCQLVHIVQGGSLHTTFSTERSACST